MLSLNSRKYKDKVQATGKQEIHRNIIEGCKLGQQRSQYQLYQLYSKAMFNVCYRMMSNREEAEDLLQDSFTDAFHRLHTFRYESSFGHWLKRVTVHKCINEIKRKKTNLDYYDDMGWFENQEEEKEEAYGNGLTVENVKKAMEHLPSGSRMIFSLYLLEGYDHVEISQILDISESNSKSQYMRARRKIKELLNTNSHETR
ncbi:MAG: RNA polymerase [Bacteroidetes bacterium]|nr:MAG: RNA polymerase [Bacteroidota bacterium]